MSARRMQFVCSFALNCLQCWCHKNSCSWLRTFFEHYYCFVKLSCVPMHMRIFHHKKLLSSVLPFNTTVFPWNASRPMCINSCTSCLDSVISIAFFFHVSELMVLNAMLLLRRLKTLPLKKQYN